MKQTVNFKDLKTKVGVDDIAYYLGYRLDRSAGVGRYIEMVLPDTTGHKDKLIIKNPKEKAAQTYFRRNGAKGGDVVSLIRENLNSFHESGRNEWEIIGKVMARFANEPIPDYGDSLYLAKAGYSDNRVFDPKLYETKEIGSDLSEVMAFFAQRGINEETVAVFAPFIKQIRDSCHTTYKQFNIGFSYTEAGKDKVVGYEIRGFGSFKSKAAGTNSTTGAWIADLSQGGEPADIRNVYFAESAYDIMAFYQLNHLRLDAAHSVFVSLGGTFSDGQVKGIMSHYSEAKAMDCFDNDLAGRIYGIRMAALLEGIRMNIHKEDSEVKITIGDKNFNIPNDQLSIRELRKHVHIRYNVGEWKAAENYKDWNDQLMGKQLEVVPIENKFARDRNLADRREKGVCL
ncbi:toprim domain-containing protein [Prevotella histicola]|jgi:hypothetical protein|uniref:toprim domain-containing protein n=1 Tax=Prevotella denticola TaxID=28129 RepID=UPI001CAF4EAF|nr:toprim domain-containing protein [Prevotella denticola]MBF1388867.1 toprim domain-containing protein [Prevotella denticola]